MLVAVGLKKSDKKKRPPVRVNHQIDIYLIHTYSLSLFLFNFNQKKKGSCDHETVSYLSIIDFPLQRPA